VTANLVEQQCERRDSDARFNLRELDVLIVILIELMCMLCFFCVFTVNYLYVDSFYL